MQKKVAKKARIHSIGVFCIQDYFLLHNLFCVSINNLPSPGAVPTPAALVNTTQTIRNGAPPRSVSASQLSSQSSPLSSSPCAISLPPRSLHLACMWRMPASGGTVHPSVRREGWLLYCSDKRVRLARTEIIWVPAFWQTCCGWGCPTKRCNQSFVHSLSHPFPKYLQNTFTTKP